MPSVRTPPVDVLTRWWPGVPGARARAKAAGMWYGCVYARMKNEEKKKSVIRGAMFDGGTWLALGRPWASTDADTSARAMSGLTRKKHGNRNP